jgi:hypothetical protein
MKVAVGNVAAVTIESIEGLVSAAARMGRTVTDLTAMTTMASPGTPALSARPKLTVGSPMPKQINPIREAFVQSHGGLDALNKKAQEAGVTLHRLLDAKNPQTYQRAIEELNGAFEQQGLRVAGINTAVENLLSAVQTAGGEMPEAMRPMLDSLLEMHGLTDQQKDKLLGLTEAVAPNFEKLEGIAKGYGIELEGLGPKFQQAALDRTAMTIHKDFEALTKAGGGDTLSGTVMQSDAKELKGILGRIERGMARDRALLPHMIARRVKEAVQTAGGRR